jgi:hypothetical protein
MAEKHIYKGDSSVIVKPYEWPVFERIQASRPQSGAEVLQEEGEALSDAASISVEKQLIVSGGQYLLAAETATVTDFNSVVDWTEGMRQQMIAAVRGATQNMSIYGQLDVKA